MSIISTIEADFEKLIKGTESDVEKFYAAFVKIAGKAPSVVLTIQNFINEVAPVLTAAVAIAVPGGAESAVVAGALALVQGGLAAVQASLTSVKTGNSLVANLQQLAASVPQLLSGLAIKNASLQALIVRIVNLITAEAKVIIPAAQSLVSQIAAGSAPATAAA